MGFTFEISSLLNMNLRFLLSRKGKNACMEFGGAFPWVQIRQPAVQFGRDLVIGDKGMKSENWDWRGNENLKADKNTDCGSITVVQREQSHWHSAF